MSEELLRIIEGMRAENKLLTDQNKPVKYNAIAFENVVKEHQKNNPVEEVKE